MPRIPRTRSLLRRLLHFRPLPQKENPEDWEGLGEEITAELLEKRRVSGELFAGRFTLREIEIALRELQILDHLEKLGFDPLVEILPGEFHRWHLRILHRASRELLGEIVLRYITLCAPPLLHFERERYHFLGIEWILLQNPHTSFHGDHPPLPGQRYPGLGIGRKVLCLLERMAQALQSDGILAVPEYYHNAVLYLRTERFFFLSPEKQGEVLALLRDLSSLDLVRSAWAVEGGFVFTHPQRKPYRWKGEEILYPLAEDLKGYFLSSGYCSATLKAFEERSFVVDKEALERFLAQRS